MLLSVHTLTVYTCCLNQPGSDEDCLLFLYGIRLVTVRCFCPFYFVDTFFSFCEGFCQNVYMIGQRAQKKRKYSSFHTCFASESCEYEDNNFDIQRTVHRDIFL